MGCCCCTQFSPQTVTYNIIKKKVKTGDLILFNNGRIGYWEVKIATCSTFSHIGMIVKCKHLKSSRDNLFIWHSPAQELQGLPDTISGDTKEGPQLNPLLPIIRAAGGTVYIRILHKKKNTFYNNILSDDPCDSGLMDFMKGADWKTYEKSTRQLILSTYDGIFGENEEDTSSYFCSELVAETYKILGLLPEDIISSEYTPKDFETTATFSLSLKKGYWLSEEYKVVISKKKKEKF